MSLTGYARKDGRKGIRNVVAVVYLVECAHHAAREIVEPNQDQEFILTCKSFEPIGPSCLPC